MQHAVFEGAKIVAVFCHKIAYIQAECRVRVLHIGVALHDRVNMRLMDNRYHHHYGNENTKQGILPCRACSSVKPLSRNHAVPNTLGLYQIAPVTNGINPAKRTMNQLISMIDVLF